MANPYWPHLSGLELHNHAEDGGEAILADNLSGAFGEIDISSVAGTNFVSNGAFTSDTTGWTAGADVAIASVAGGQSGNCLQITEDGSDNPVCHQVGTGLVIGKRYRFSFYVKNGTGTQYWAQLYCGVSWPSAGAGPVTNTAATGSWVQFSYYFVAAATTWDLYLYHFATSGDGTTILFDTVEVVREGAGTISVNDTQVLGAQGAAVADATDAASVIARLNDLLAILRTHGLIAT